jgi:hypothetical protein
MAHCGYEGTAVNDAVDHPLKALTVFLRGPKITGAMAPELPVEYAAAAGGTLATIPLDKIGRSR